MTVQDLLNRKKSEIYSVSPKTTVYDSIAKMAELNIGALLVMEGEKLLGIISERDYRNKVILKGRTSKETAVHQIMTDQVVCVKTTDSANLCMQLMTQKKIRHLPVLEENQVVGVVSIGDVVKSIIENQRNEIDSLHNYITGGYPA